MFRGVHIREPLSLATRTIRVQSATNRAPHSMIIGAGKSQIDHVWNACWSGRFANPMCVINQITHIGFLLLRLDDLHTLEENRSATA
jgi:hypothetical protein